MNLQEGADRKAVFPCGALREAALQVLSGAIPGLSLQRAFRPSPPRTAIGGDSRLRPPATRDTLAVLSMSKVHHVWFPKNARAAIPPLPRQSSCAC